MGYVSEWYIDKTRENLNPRCTVTIAEPGSNWIEHPEIAKHVDYVMINSHPYFSGVDISNASNKVLEEYLNVKESLKDMISLIQKITTRN